MIRFLLNWLGGGIIQDLTRTYRETVSARLQAETDEQRMELDRQLASIANQRDIALAQLQRRWNPVTVGGFLIVVPFGLWWAAIFAVSVINPNFGTVWSVQAVPPEIMGMAKILVPGILIADSGQFLVRRFLPRR